MERGLHVFSARVAERAWRPSPSPFLSSTVRGRGNVGCGVNIAHPNRRHLALPARQREWQMEEQNVGLLTQRFHRHSTCPMRNPGFGSSSYTSPVCANCIPSCYLEMIYHFCQAEPWIREGVAFSAAGHRYTSSVTPTTKPLPAVDDSRPTRSPGCAGLRPSRTVDD